MRPRRGAPGQNAVGLPTAVNSPIAISWHYPKNRLQSLRMAKSARGPTGLLVGHSVTRSHRSSVGVLPATNGPKTLCFTKQLHCTTAHSRTGIHRPVGRHAHDTTAHQWYNTIRSMLRVKHINILCGYNIEFLSVRAGDTQCYGSNSKCYQLITLAIHPTIILSDQYVSSLPADIPMRVRWDGILSRYGLCDKGARNDAGEIK
jgi:hypothetical protein